VGLEAAGLLFSGSGGVFNHHTRPGLGNVKNAEHQGFFMRSQGLAMARADRHIHPVGR